jgi:exonuclease SbcD
LRLLLFSDLHLDAPFRWAGPEAGRTRRRNLEETLKTIVQLVDETQADALCCGGDLYEQDRFTPNTGEFLRAVFESLYPTPVFIAPGNHDWFGPRSLYHQFAWSPNVHIFTESSLSPVELADGITLWGAAHRKPAGTPDLLSGFKVNRSGANLALFHGSESAGFAWQEQGKVAHAPFAATEIVAAGLDHALLGHYHCPTDGERHTYPGNPDPLEFGEEGDRGAVLLTVAGDGSVQRERHRVACSAVADVVIDLTGVTHTDEARDRVRDNLVSYQGFVRATLVGEVAPDVDLHVEEFTTSTVAPQLEVLIARLEKVTVAYDFEALAREQTVRGQFVQDVIGTESLDADRRRRVLVTGLRALAGRDDLAVR